MLNLEDGSDRVESKIVSRDYERPEGWPHEPMIITMNLACGHKIVRTAPRATRGTWMYCEECREKNRSSKK